MLTKSIDQITEMDLQGLVDNSVIEWKSLEYKAVLPGNSEADKKEFLADVSSFANSIGGDIFFGIVCHKATGTPKALEGIPVANLDQEVLRLDNLMRDGIKPRITGVTMQPIHLSNSKAALIVRIGKSWNPPHRVTFKGHDKFYGRSTNGKYQLDVDELRNIFNLSATTADRIRNFRIDRINKILADDTPVPLLSSPKTVLHVVPLISFTPGQVYDITAVYQDSRKLRPIQPRSWDRRYNLDGIVAFSVAGQTNPYGYVQLFKNGIIEATDASMLQPLTPALTIPSVLFEQELMKSLSAYLTLLKELSVELPGYIFISVLRVKDYRMATSGRWLGLPSSSIDRDHLLVPEAIVDSYDVEAKDILRPCFDSVWNASGYPRSLCYDKNGNWTGQV